jgi:parvulin-like peptidyl-prolyl isomerase
MGRGCIVWGFAASLMALVATQGAAQEVIDRVAARVENDIVLLSDVRVLARYQQLVDGKSESDAQILDRLIDQWIVRNEAETARFPRPSDDEVSRGVERVQKSFTSAEEYEARKKQVGLTAANIRTMVTAQLYLSNYLDSRFRPSVKIEPKEVEDFYDKAVIPRAQARGQAPPSLDAARDYIRDALIQRSIDEQAERWLNESRGRVHVEKMLEPSAP